MLAKISDNWILTADLWFQRQTTLYHQLIHNQRPTYFFDCLFFRNNNLPHLEVELNEGMTEQKLLSCNNLDNLLSGLVVMGGDSCPKFVGSNPSTV